MKECTLCKQAARMFCESDRASLCWDCDAKVHGANFLVARHTRCLLCRSCQAPTPWKASGSRLGPTMSVCEKCMGGGCMEREEAGSVEVRDGGHRDGVEDETEDDEEEEMGLETDSEEEDESEGEEGENQVVPWSIAGETEMPPPVASSSSSEESSSGCGYTKQRENADLRSSQGDVSCSPSSYSRYLAVKNEASSRWTGLSAVAERGRPAQSLSSPQRSLQLSSGCRNPLI